MDNQDYLRYIKEWEIGPGMTEIASKANAVFQFLVNEGELTPMDEDTQERLETLLKRKYELEKELEKNPDPAPASITQLEQINQEVEEIKEEYSDVYDLELQSEDDWGYLYRFFVDKIQMGYVVGDEYDMEHAAKQYLEELYEDISVDSLPDWLLEDAVDKDSVVELFREMFEEDVNENPEDFLEDSDRDLSKEQQLEVQKIDFEMKDLNKKIAAFELAQKNEKDESKLKFIEQTISKFENKKSILQEQREEITNSPEGDFNEDAIERQIKVQVEDVESDPLEYLRNFGLDKKNYLDMDRVYELILENDGFGVMSSYDGEVNEEIVNGDLFYIIRVE